MRKTCKKLNTLSFRFHKCNERTNSTILKPRYAFPKEFSQCFYSEQHQWTRQRKERISVYNSFSLCVSLSERKKKIHLFAWILIKAVKELQGHNKLHCALPKEFCQAAILNSNEWAWQCLQVILIPEQYIKFVLHILH